LVIPKEQSVKGYDLLERIGEGAYGAVYRAYQQHMRREVAIKIIQPRIANQPNFIRRFDLEAHLVAQLEHLHIVPLYDYWREPDGAYLVMRLMKGGSLEKSLKKDGSWEPERAAHLVDQIASALDAAHKQGVVHRDLKPANILLDEQGNAYLSDFGIAKELKQGGTITQTGAIVGTPAYISPEQVQSQPVTPQTDIYSLGVAAYELLAGGHPFLDTPSAELVLKHLNEPLPLVRERRPELTKEVDRVIQQATAKDPNSRYADALALAVDFRQALQLEVEAPEVPESEIYNPYKGLRPFQEADAGDFYGRDGLIKQLLARMEERSEASRFLALVGPSGSGKSSVVKAGLLPALRAGGIPGSGDWFITEMKPGVYPLEELELAILRVATIQPPSLLGQIKEDPRGLLRAVRRVLPEGSQLLLVVDQFEELFSLVRNSEESNFFMASVYEAVSDSQSPLRVVITLRADYYDRPLKHPEFSSLIEKRTQVVKPLSTSEIEQAICEPANRLGVTFESGLTSTIVGEVHEEPGALPILEYALTELFERREERMITKVEYEMIGGVRGALALRAEQLYSRFDEQGQESTRQMLLRMVTLGEGQEDTRRRVLLSEVKVQKDVIDSFDQARLLTFDHDPQTRVPTVEVAHEALLQEWGRLREWLDESRADIRMQRVLGNAAEEWRLANRDPGFLLRGSRLDQFAAWIEITDLALTQIEQDYLDASLEERRTRQAIEAERLAHEAALERRSRNFLRGLVAVLGIAAVVAVVLSIYAFNQQGIAQSEARQRATQQAIAESEADQRATQQAIAEAETDARATQQAIAEEQRAIAEEQQAIRAREAEVNHSLFLASQSQIAVEANNIDLALALAWEANQIPDPPGQAQMALSVAAYAPAGTIRRYVDHKDQVWFVDLSPDGKYLLSGTESGEIFLWDVATGEILHRLEGHTGPVGGIAFSPDGRFALTSGQDENAYYWDLETREVVHHFTEPGIQFNVPAISPDGRIAALSSGRYLDFIPFQEDNNIRLWDLETGEVIHQIPFSDGVTMVDFSPDGSMLVASTVADGIVVLDVATGEVLYRFLEEMMNMTVAAFIQEGRSLLAAGGGSQNHLVQIDLATGDAITYESSHNDLPFSIAISPDGKRALTTSDDDTREWELESREQIQALGLPGTSMTYNSDGRAAFVGSRDSMVHLIALESGAFAEGARIPLQSGGVRSTAYSPDGDSVLYSVPRGEMVYLFDLESGQLSQQFNHTPYSPFAVAFSPDGQFVLSTYYDDGSLSYWDVHTGEEILRMGAEGTVHNRLADAVAFHPSGQFALSGAQSDNNQVVYWDLTTGEPVWTSNREEFVVAAVYGLDISPDGKTGLTRDNYLTLWNLDNGEELLRLSPEGVEWGWDVAFLDDQTAIVSEGSRMILWDLNNGTAIRDYLGHSGQIKGLALSPDGRLGVSASRDSTLILWDISTGEPLRRYYGHHDDVNTVAFSPDGQEIFSGSRAGEAFRWRVDTDLEALQAWVAANRILPELSCSERQFYNIQPLCDE